MAHFVHLKKKPKKANRKEVIILGAGITGLSAGYTSGQTIYEAGGVAGGICTSYYMKTGLKTRFFKAPRNGEAYHFEIGGGHWIFGGDSTVHRFINALSPMKTYVRVSSVYLPRTKTFIPYPLQNNLSFLDKVTAEKAKNEILGKKDGVDKTLGDGAGGVVTMDDWLRESFGQTLCNLFFFPFHELYTAGLWKKIAPQDGYKSPINKKDVLEGFEGKTRTIGYNATFVYPENGLDHLTRRLAEKCNIRYNKMVEKIDVREKIVYFADGESKPYGEIISTLPLNAMVNMTGIEAGRKPAHPSPAVLVINIGAKRGFKCPMKNEQWIYIPESRTGFHRVGFYDAVDTSFIPKSNRDKHDRASIYVEKAYQEGQKPTPTEMDKVSKETIKELQEWGWIGEVEVYDPTWINTAYTWAWPESNWKEMAIKELEKHNIYQIGRYGRWIFQGIADSIKDGLMIGGAFSAL